MRQRIQVVPFGEDKVLLRGRASVAVRVHLALGYLRVEAVDRWLVRVMMLAAMTPFPSQRCVSVRVGAAGANVLDRASDVTIGFDVYHLLGVWV